MELDPDPFEQVSTLFARLLDQRRQQEQSEPVVPSRTADELRAELALELPEEGLPLEQVARRLEDLVRRTPSTASRRFFNQLFGGREPAALLGEMTAAALNGSMYTFKIGGPQILVELELVKRMGAAVGLTDPDGVFTPGGSISNLSGMMLARDRACPRLRDEGADGRRMRVYTSVDAHYSVAKAAAALGIGRHNVVQVAVDRRGRMEPAALDRAIRADLDAGHLPIQVNATIGTTVLGAFDPLDALAEVARAHDLWLHADGAFGGSAILDPGQAHLLAGSEQVDSMAWDAHKLMGVPLSCSVFLVRERGLMAASLDEAAGYLFQGDGDELNPGTRSLQCGRRNDALKLWSTWQHLGTRGLGERIARFRELALLSAERVRREPELELVREPEFVNVCFAAEGVPAPLLCDELARRGQALVGHATVDGREVVRLALTNTSLDAGAVEALFDAVVQAARDLRTGRLVGTAS